MAIFRLTHLAGMALLAVVVAAGTARATKADPSVTNGLQNFGDLGEPLADGSPTGNINTATTFTVAELTSAGGQLGIFLGLPRQIFNPFTFNPGIPTSFDFGNGVFGHFASTSITETVNVAGAVAFDVTGEWTPGSFFHAGLKPFGTLFTISFTQTPAHTGIISNSATLSVPVTTIIPEPSSIVLVLTGLAAAVGIYGLRRRRRYLVTA